MRFYNSLTKNKDEFQTQNNEVRMYCCGPTVYNYFHVGNARVFVIFDMLRKYLQYRGNKVTFVQNFTDIDDKMIKKANEEGTTVKAIADRYIEEYFKDAKGLGIDPASIHPRATENIDEIIAIINSLIEKGYAYQSAGDVYFSARKFNGYGKLSGRDVDDLESGARIDISDIKRDPLDFALWKGQKPGEPAWDSPFGKGRPGWHIECSAMSHRYLGDNFDIHCGGEDLKFPHHENEIAQSEAAFEQQFCRFWLHNGYINVDNKKMSKSLGNFFTVRDAAEKYSYGAIRFFILSAHYRSPVNFSQETLEQSKTALERLYNCEDNIKYAIENASGEISAQEKDFVISLSRFREKFISVMDDDFNTADGISVIFELVKEINIFLSSPHSKECLVSVSEIYSELAGLMGLLKPEKITSDEDDEEIAALVCERTSAKKEKNYARADEIRDILKQKGIVLEDTPNGVKWKRI